jgi:hypothetical protein
MDFYQAHLLLNREEIEQVHVVPAHPPVRYLRAQAGSLQAVSNKIDELSRF